MSRLRPAVFGGPGVSASWAGGNSGNRLGNRRRPIFWGWGRSLPVRVRFRTGAKPAFKSYQKTVLNMGVFLNTCCGRSGKGPRKSLPGAVGADGSHGVLTPFSIKRK